MALSYPLCRAAVPLVLTLAMCAVGGMVDVQALAQDWHRLDQGVALKADGTLVVKTFGLDSVADTVETLRQNFAGKRGGGDNKNAPRLAVDG